MPHLPPLRVVPLSAIRRHEEVDPLRVGRLSERIGSDGTQVNPMMCLEASGGDLVLLDGATRTESMKRLGLKHAVVQLVDPMRMSLGTWHHVVRGVATEEVLGTIRDADGITLVKGVGTPAVHTHDGDSFRVTSDILSDNAALSAVVRAYVGKWTVNRSPDPRVEAVTGRFPDWAVIVEFPTLTVEDVMKAAISNDPLPAGITRFVVPERALRLNMPLDVLAADRSVAEKQIALDDLLEERARAGRIRRYEEPVFILDE
jgi:L-serine kinase (ATP) / ParB family transcriptional regulator, heme-responsive regulator